MTETSLAAGNALVMSAAFLMLSYHYWVNLPGFGGGRRGFVIWVSKGLLVPLWVWIAINSGLLPGMPVLSPEVAIAVSQGKGWLSALALSSSRVLFLISSFWAAITFVWLTLAMGRMVPDRREFDQYCLFYSLFLIPVAALVFMVAGVPGWGLAMLIWLAPIVHLNGSMIATRAPKPNYSPAVARLMFGKYKDAELEIISELAKSENDFEGWMMLADLYANHFNDLPEADRTIRELCTQPDVTAVHISVAFHRLADWHLKLADDPDNARSALEAIVLLMPGSHFARMAQQRIDQLPATREDLLDQRKPKVFRLPALGDPLDEDARNERPQVSMTEARAQADRLVERLKRNPDDVETRESFAVLLGEQFGKTDSAIEQLNLLIGIPDQPASKYAEWLALIAAWQIRYRHDPDAAKALLERILREFPKTPQALAARRRLELMESERLTHEANRSR
jgi:hypothetical protein